MKIAISSTPCIKLIYLKCAKERPPDQQRSNETLKLPKNVSRVPREGIEARWRDRQTSMKYGKCIINKQATTRNGLLTEIWVIYLWTLCIAADRVIVSLSARSNMGCQKQFLPKLLALQRKTITSQENSP